MSNDEWILNEEEEEADLAQDRGAYVSPPQPVDALVGKDAAGAVSVYVDRESTPVSVTLIENWRREIDPRSLHAHVLEAANAATLQALAAKVDEVDPSQTGEAAQTQSDPTDNSRITPADAMRLLDEVSADLARFTEQLSSVADTVTRTESAGGRVSGSGQGGQVIQVSLDPSWAASSRRSEIESEILSFLSKLSELSSPGDLARGPQSRSITELITLASDPQRLMRRVGLTI